MKSLAALLWLSSVVVTSGSAQAGQRPAGTIITSNMNDNTATMIDAATGRVIATLPTGEAPHEVAVSHDGRWAIVSNYGVRGKPGSTLTLIDVARHVVLRTIDLQPHQRPHGAAFLPGDSQLVVTSEASKAVLVVDVASGLVQRAMPTNGRTSHMVAISADAQVMVTANISDGTISLMDPFASGDSAVAIKVTAQPEGIAISPEGRTAWVGSDRDSVVVIVDLVRRVAVDTIRGFGLPYRLAFTPDGKRVVVTDPAAATVRILDAATHREVHHLAIAADSLVPTAEVPGSPSPEGVTTSPDSRWAFVTLQGRNRVITIDIATGLIAGTAVTGTWSDGVAFSPVRPSGPS